MAQTKCPHCGFLNFAISAYCGRCERPLKVETPTMVTTESAPTGPNTIRSMPPRAPKMQLVPPPSRPTAPLPPESLARNPDAPVERTVIDRPPEAPPPRDITPAAEQQRDQPTQTQIRHPPVEKTVIDRTFSRATLKIPEEPAFTRDRPDGQTPASIFERLTPKVEPPRPDEAPTQAPQQGKRREESLSLRETVQPEEVQKLLRPDTQEVQRKVRVQATTVNFDPSAPTQISAGSAALWQVAAATALDALIVAVVGLAIAGAEMLIFDVHWPTDATGLDALGIWLHIYPRTALRAIGGMMTFAFVYNVVGAHRGRTVGRALLGLRLVRREGMALAWPFALMRGIFSLVSVGFFGAGYFWMLMDTQHRTWGDLASRAVVVRR